MDEYVKSLTSFGKSLLDSIKDVGGNLIVDSIIISNTKLKPSDLNSIEQSTLSNSLIFPIIDVKTNGNLYYALASIDNININSDFTANTIALVAHKDTDNNKDIIIVVSDNNPLVLHSSIDGFQQETITFKMSVPIKMTNQGNNGSNTSSNSNSGIDSDVFNSLTKASSAYNNQNEYDKTLMSNKLSNNSKQADAIFNQLSNDNAVNQSNINANSAVALQYFNQNGKDITDLKSYVDTKIDSLANKK